MYKWRMAILTGHSCAYSTPGGQVGPRTKISASLADGLDHSLGLVSSVEQDDRQ